MQQGNEENVIVRTNVIKRNGQEVTFDITKIINAIGKANHEVAGIHQMNNFQLSPRGQCRRYPGYGRNGHHGNARL